MKNPHLRKLEQMSGFTVWIVDGKYIRANLGEEFTNFGEHYVFPFIPKREFWIDKGYGKHNEEKFYIDNLLLENRLMSRGVTYAEAHEKACALEKRERRKSRLARIIRTEAHKKLIEKIHKKLLKSYSEHVSVWIVRSDLVRDSFDIDFTEGGHDKVYSFVPRGEIWIDDDVSPRERKFVVLHEMHERYLMTKGAIYYNAHRGASAIEYECREHPELLKRRLAEEIKREY